MENIIRQEGRQEELLIEVSVMRKEMFFSKLLGDCYQNDLTRILREAHVAQIPCDGKFHLLILLEVDNCGGYYVRKKKHADQDERSEMQFILTNIGKDLLSFGKRCSVTFGNYEDRLIFWLESDSDSITAEEIIKAAEKICSAVENHFQMAVSVVIGEWLSDLLMASEEYKRLKDVLFFNRFLGCQKSIFHEPITPGTPIPCRFSWDIRTTENLYLSLRERAFEDVRRGIKRLHCELFVKEPKTAKTYRPYKDRFQLLLQMILWELDEMLPGVVPVQEILMEMETEESGLEWLEDMDRALDMAQDAISGEKQQKPEWIDQLKEIILEEYADVNLSVYSLADRVGLGASYCTRIFRSHVGLSLLDYIRQVRSKEALRLIAEGTSMPEVARLTGFGCVRTLQRTLQRHKAL